MITCLSRTVLALFCLIASSPPEDLPKGILAEGKGVRITENDFFEYLTSLYEKDELGKTLLEQVVRETAIRQEAERRGLAVSEKDLERTLDLLDRRTLAESGGKQGIRDYIRESEIDEQDFFDALRLHIAHEMMARKDFGIQKGQEISVEKLNVWLTELLGKTEVELAAPGGGAVAVINGEQLTRAFFGRRISTLIKPQKKKDLLTQMIGVRLIRAKAREMEMDLDAADLEREIGEREARLRSRKGFEGISYGSYLKAATGRTLDELKAGETFQSEVLLKKICQALHHEAYLQEFYEGNQDYFNRRFGKAARFSTIFLKAVAFSNPLTDQVSLRNFDEAMDELKAIKSRLERGEVAFENMARIYSEHDSKKSGGDLGFIPPGTPGWEDVSRAGLLAEVGAILGPLKTHDGCHLVKVCEKREDPPYETIREEVAREARQRYYRRLLEEGEIRRRF